MLNDVFLLLKGKIFGQISEEADSCSHLFFDIFFVFGSCHIESKNLVFFFDVPNNDEIYGWALVIVLQRFVFPDMRLSSNRFSLVLLGYFQNVGQIFFDAV